MLCSTVLVKALLYWVFQKALIVLNLLPARFLVIIIPINTVILCLMVSNSLASISAGNANFVSFGNIKYYDSIIDKVNIDALIAFVLCIFRP